MKYIVAAIAFCWMMSIHAQGYGGPPMWDRYGDYESGGRMPPTHWGPNENCWIYGRCRGPRYEEDPYQTWRRPRKLYPDRYPQGYPYPRY